MIGFWINLVGSSSGHNWHHKFPFDYASSEYHWHPAKGFIDMCAFLGLAYDRKSAQGAWKLQKKQEELKPRTT